jgi:hypothetical protein
MHMTRVKKKRVYLTWRDFCIFFVLEVIQVGKNIFFSFFFFIYGSKVFLNFDIESIVIYPRYLFKE